MAFLSLNPKASAGKKAQVTPLVVFNILDHYKRRTSEQHRVVGALLGERVRTKSGEAVLIKNSFPVPHVESEDQVIVDMAYHKSMVTLHKHVNAKESVIGWYSSGAKISYTSSLIHQQFTQMCNRDPIHLTVDAELTDYKMGVFAYVGRPIKIDDEEDKQVEVIARFDRVPLSFHMSEPVTIAVDAMIKGTPDDQKLDAPAMLLSDLENIELSLGRLLDLLQSVSAYVDRVNAGEEEGTPEIGTAIQEALASVPIIDPDVFVKAFNQNVQDLLMVLYLSNLTRTQLALADRIYEVLD